MLQVDVGRIAGEIYELYEAKGSILVGASNGLFRLEGNELKAIAADQNTGGVSSFYNGRGTLFVGASNGAFRLDNDKLTRIPADRDTGAVYGYYDANGIILVRTANGLFRLDGDKLTRITADHKTGAIFGFYAASGSVLVGTYNGLFRLDANKLTQIAVDRPTGRINEFNNANGTLFVAGVAGVFRLEKDKLARIPVDKDTGSINELYDVNGTLFVAAVKGVFCLQKNRLTRIAADQDTDQVYGFYNANGTLLVKTFNGLFRLDGDRLKNVVGRQALGAVTNLYNANGTLLVGATNGLFRLDGNKVTQIAADQVSDAVYGFYDTKHTLLVRAKNGLFRLDIDPWANAIVTPDRLSEDVPVRTLTTLKWTVKHACAFGLTQHEIRIVPDLDSSKAWEVTIKHVSGATEVEATGAFLTKNDTAYHVQLELKEDTGKFVPVGKHVSLLVGWTFYDYVEYYGWWAILIVSATYVASFLLLIIGARWSALCWRIVTDPVWNKLQIGFYFALRYAGPLQRWVMARWFDEVRKGTSREPYLPMTLGTDDEEATARRSTDLLEHDAEWRRLWIQGNPGMGKTAMVRYLQSQFFAGEDLPTLRGAFKRFRCVPIIVSLREYRHVAFDPSHPEDWVISVARMAASALGVTFEGDGPFRSMIKSGCFLLILDGANEVERDDAIDLFARSAPKTRILVTSQVPKEGSYFANLHLPRTITDEVEPLLRLFLGQEAGERTFASIRATPLLSAIQSGYDVRLIANLIETQGSHVVIPTDRLGLYQLILSTIHLPDGTQFPEENLCKAAWAMWCDGDRNLEIGKHIAADLLPPLVREGQKVLRTLDGQRFEFRHDLMRAYLAARWAAHHEANPEGLLEHKKAIWRLSYKEQDEVWSFFADMVLATNLPLAIKLWKWAAAHADRVILQHALQRALKQAGLDPEITARNQPPVEDREEGRSSNGDCAICAAVRFSNL